MSDRLASAWRWHMPGGPGVSRLIQRLVALAYFVAFASLLAQVQVLFSARGLAPLHARVEGFEQQGLSPFDLPEPDESALVLRAVVSSLHLTATARGDRRGLDPPSGRTRPHHPLPAAEPVASTKIGGHARRLRYTRQAMGTASGYTEDMTLREARALYFRDNEFGDDGGYHKKWVKVMLGPVPVYVYNGKMRVDAVRYHDLHHVVTGYATDLRGEAQIGAWEVAAGCGTKLAAWFLNLGAMVVGVVVDRSATFEAFVRGRHSRTLYDQPFSEELLDETVGAMRSRLSLDQPIPEATTADRVAYLGWLVVGTVANLMPLAALVAVIWALVAFIF